jgi:hypothetical protein
MPIKIMLEYSFLAITLAKRIIESGKCSVGYLWSNRHSLVMLLGIPVGTNLHREDWQFLTEVYIHLFF